MRREGPGDGVGPGRKDDPASQDRPPRLARRIASLLLPPREATRLLAALDEEYAEYQRPARGRRGADLWYGVR